MTLADAHKTGRKYRRTSEEHCDYWRFGVTDDMENTSLCGEEIFADDWEVEPEVYEVECTWNCDGDKIYPFTGEGFFADTNKNLKGKRTKLTIEVLD